MKREILFRAKRKDGQGWIEGFYKRVYGKDYIIKDNEELDYPAFRVIPETVGQLSSLKDKKSVKIFDGDILKIQLPMGGFWGNVKTEKIGVVGYEPDYGAYIVRWEYSKNQHHIILNCDIACESEIIGNIYDNAEILNQPQG